MDCKSGCWRSSKTRFDEKVCGRTTASTETWQAVIEVELSPKVRAISGTKLFGDLNGQSGEREVDQTAVGGEEEVLHT